MFFEIYFIRKLLFRRRKLKKNVIFSKKIYVRTKYCFRKYVFKENSFSKTIFCSKRILITILYYSLFQKHDVHVFKQMNKIIMFFLKLQYI